MTIRDQIAQRHLLPAAGLEPTIKSPAQYVRIIVSEHWAASTSGQLITSCLVNLLCRQAKLVRHIEIVVPQARNLVRLPSGDSAKPFPDCLRDLAEWAVGGTVTVSTIQTTATADHTLFVGGQPCAQALNQEHALTLVADGWRAWVGDPSRAPRSISPTSTVPLGPFLAAALAAGEIFKRSRGILRGKFLSGDGYSLWTGASSPDWYTLEDGPTTTGIYLPPTHLVGTGAVGNALAYIIASLGLTDGYVVAIDDDRYDETNLNRCPLAGWLDVGDCKVNPIARTLRAANVGVFHFAGDIKSYVADGRTGLSTNVARQVDDLTFEVVASCVDKGISRHDIQGLRPRLLCGGSTLDLQAKSNLYTGRRGSACLACFNPAEQHGEKIRALESQLRKAPADERGRFLREHGFDVPAVEGYLSGARCGNLGEAALKDFATRPAPEFSTGFVSLGAGLLLAAALLRNTAFLSAAPRRPDMASLNFLNGGFGDSNLGADDACELRCQERLAAFTA